MRPAHGLLGLAVYAVFCIAGRLHTGRSLGLGRIERLGAIALVIAVGLRAAPGFGWFPPGPIHGLSVIFWAGAFLAWAAVAWREFTRTEDTVANGLMTTKGPERAVPVAAK